MSGVKKFLIVLEIVLCFGFIFFQLFLGVLFLPSQMLMLADGHDTFAWVALTIGGLVGLVGMVKCVRNLFADRGPLNRPLIVIAMIATGVAAIVSQLPSVLKSGLTFVEVAVYIAPLLCTAHIVYLSRHAFRRPP